jgi:hypothetical protein
MNKYAYICVYVHYDDFEVDQRVYLTTERAEQRVKELNSRERSHNAWYVERVEIIK